MDRRIIVWNSAERGGPDALLLSSDRRWLGLCARRALDAGEENLGLLHGLKVMERTSWGLSDTVVLRGPASVDEDGRPTGPDELEVKISSPTRMGLGEWFKDEELYLLEFGPQSEDTVKAAAEGHTGIIVIPAMTVVERTLWGLSMTCRLRVDAGKGKNIEVKLSLPWPEDRFLKEGQLYSVIFEPVKGEEEVEPGEEQPYRQEGWNPPKLTLQHLDEALEIDLDRLEKLLVRPREYVSFTVMEQMRRLWDDIGPLEDDDADDE